MRIYLNVCCLNRPFDDQSQDRIHLESEAVILILKHLRSGSWEWVSSEVVQFEVGQIPDLERRYRVESLIRYADRTVLIGPPIIKRGCELAAIGFGVYDALHLACAEEVQVNTFLTTDDRLLWLAREGSAKLIVKVENPLTWFREVIEDE